MTLPLARPAGVALAMANAPSLIEHIWPVQKVSVEAQKERKAGPGQTLTALGSYWKGRKPLVLVNACILGSLLPWTGDHERDLETFETLMGIADDQTVDRLKAPLSVDDIVQHGTADQIDGLLETEGDGSGFKMKPLAKAVQRERMADIVASMPYSARMDYLWRPEEISDALLIDRRLARVNSHLGTTARSVADVIAQLGTMRFGRRPLVADLFCGGGSIPFAAARLGCDAYGSDLNPIAAMLTWASVHIIGADKTEGERLLRLQQNVVREIDAELLRLGIEHDAVGNRAKTYLYCLETRCPRTGWMIPMSTTWVISGKRNVVARLVPDERHKRFDIDVVSGIAASEVNTASVGTVQGGDLVYELGGDQYRTPISSLRGDYKKEDGSVGNGLRPWNIDDVKPRISDIFQDRLYCVHWLSSASLKKHRPSSFFAAPTADDMERERLVESIVAERLSDWQDLGLVPNMRIEPGKETSRLCRERGWTHWHHLFSPRHLLILAMLRERIQKDARLAVSLCNALDFSSKLTRWVNSGRDGGGSEFTANVFSNQALNTLTNYGQGAFIRLAASFIKPTKSFQLVGQVSLGVHDARASTTNADIFITDPPYADAINYHEITEYFIAWLRQKPPPPMDEWLWDSRRALAIRGQGEEFRKTMTQAYHAMAELMPENGIQIVMFTHQDAGVWSDMALIFWGSSLQVMAAWYIATETTSESKKGGYVQGTVILVLRKRAASLSGYKDEIVQEVRFEVGEQIETLTGLNQTLKGHGRVENLFEDADLQMAGYAAALRVLTRYAKIDGVDMTKEALRSRRTSDSNMISEIIEFAVQVANEHMVPDGLSKDVWDALLPAERFYLKMLDVETTGARKLDNYQNFAKAFRVADYTRVMASSIPNKARLKTATEFKRSTFEGSEFGLSTTRAILFAIFEIGQDVDGTDVLSHLRDLVSSYYDIRARIVAIAEYLGAKWATTNADEARSARVLYGLLRSERLG